MLYTNKGDNIYSYCVVKERFTPVGDGREQFTVVLPGGGPGIIAEGSALSKTWHSPLPDSTLIDFKPLITTLKDSKTYRRYTAEDGREYISWN